MDSGTSARPSNYAGGGEATVSSFITFIILLAGVVGGLTIVVLVILICKYCVKGKKPNERSIRDGSHDGGGHAIRMLQRYETINSDVFSEPSSASLDGVPLSPRKPIDVRARGRRDEAEEVNERTQLRSSYEMDSMFEQQAESGFMTPDDKDTGTPIKVPRSATIDHVATSDARLGAEQKEEKAAGEQSPSNQQQNGGKGNSSSRRVSFQLDDKFSRHKSQSLRKSRRYTEGDFHYLKYAKITTLPRQLSLGTAPPKSAPARPIPSLGATATDTAFRYSLDERLRILQEDAEKNFPLLHVEPPQPSVTSQGRILPSPARSPRATARLGGRDASQEKTLAVASRGAAEVALPRLRLSPSPPRYQRGDRWRRTPSASPSPPGEPVHRQVNVEVHYHQGEDAQGPSIAGQQETLSQRYAPMQEIGRQQSVPVHDGKKKAAAHAEAPRHRSTTSQDSHRELVKQHSVPVHVQRTQAYQKKAASHSLELVSSRRHMPSRKVKSYDDVADYDVLQITEFSRGPFYNTGYDVISELASPTSSKVRYNDTGSLEDLQEETPGELSCLALEALLPPDESDDTSTLNGSHQNREIWLLRATLEEEEECSDTIRMEDMTSPDDSPEREHLHTTSFESTVPSDACASDQRDSGIQWESRAQGEQPAQREGGAQVPEAPSRGCGRDGAGGGPAQLLHPNYEHRRQNYRNLLSGRLAKAPPGASVAAVLGPGSAENSFDSVETDGDVSDTSRQEATTTSFESTTDNTDSTTESQHSRLRQMKTDSGYKSLETQQSGVRDVGEVPEAVVLPEEVAAERADVRRDPGGVGHESRRNGDGHASGSGGGGGGGGRGDGGSGAHYVREGCPGPSAEGRVEVVGGRRNSNAVHFERRAGRTASKKRREYSRERQLIQFSSSLQEAETAPRPELHSLESFDETAHRRHSNASSRQHQPPSSAPFVSSSKRSVFTRFFSHGHGREAREKYLVRDYSIDQKTNQIFNEFLRQETSLESGSAVAEESAGVGSVERSGYSAGGARLGLRRSPRSQTRPRIQRKHTEPVYRLDDRRRDRLVPEMRSTSMGSDSSASSARRLSPQDSIEEELEEVAEAEMKWKHTELAPMLEVGDATAAEDESKSPFNVTQAATHDIPVIQLPEEEVKDGS